MPFLSWIKTVRRKSLSNSFRLHAGTVNRPVSLDKLSNRSVSGPVRRWMVFLYGGANQIKFLTYKLGICKKNGRTVCLFSQKRQYLVLFDSIDAILTIIQVRYLTVNESKQRPLRSWRPSTEGVINYEMIIVNSNVKLVRKACLKINHL